MIRQVLDPAHKYWVQGGVFHDLRTASNNFLSEPIFLPAPNSLPNLLSWHRTRNRLSFERYILFSSLTPLENYHRFWKSSKFIHTEVGVWFTHKEGALSQKEFDILKKSKRIFVHSKRIRSELQSIGLKNVVVTLGAINPSLFSAPARKGCRVAWVGTPTSRKRPELLLDLAQRMSDVDFRLLGKGWKSSKYWNTVSSISNLEYVEIQGPLSSSSFNDCAVFLMTSDIEGGPMPLMESLASGLLPVCTNTGFVDDLCEIVGLAPLEKITDDLCFMENLLRSSLNEAKQNKTFNRNALLEYDYKRLANIITEELTSKH